MTEILNQITVHRYECLSILYCGVRFILIRYYFNTIDIKKTILMIVMKITYMHIYIHNPYIITNLYIYSAVNHAKIEKQKV